MRLESDSLIASQPIPSTQVPRARFALATREPEPPSLTRSNDLYDALAANYDATTPRIEALREEAHRLLDLKQGDTVIDVGCGTGKSLVALSQAVGERGFVVAIEPSHAMIEIARGRVREHRLTNVELIEAPASSIDQHVPAASVDAVLLMFTHDVLQSQTTIDRLLAIAKPGAHFALSGGKLFSGPLALLNPWVEWRQKPYCTTFENYDAPWRKLFATGALESTRVHPKYLGIAYIAYGVRSKQ
jgi:SAM-dependent methyltransferase